MMQKPMHLTLRLNVGHFKSQSIVEVGHPQPIENEQSEKISPEQERKVEPDLLAMEILPEITKAVKGA